MFYGVVQSDKCHLGEAYETKNLTGPTPLNGTVIINCIAYTFKVLTVINANTELNNSVIL